MRLPLVHESRRAARDPALAGLPVTVFASIGYGFFSCVDTAAADATRSYDGI